MKCLRWIVMATALIAGGPASAGRHHICYVDALDSTGQPLGVYGCNEDAGGTCSIAAPPGASTTSIPYTPPPNSSAPSGDARHFKLPYGANTATISFWNAGSTGAPDAQFRCTITAQPYYVERPMADADALMGYTTDSSGLLTTAVWKRAQPGTGRRSSYSTVTVPSDFVVVGGGVVGKEWPNGSLVYESRHLIDPYNSSQQPTFRQWRGSTFDNTVEDLDAAVAYAIGMKIEGLGPDTLRTTVTRTATFDAGFAPHPSEWVNFPPGMVMLSGSVWASSPDPNVNSSATPYMFGQYLTGTAPLDTNAGWAAKSKDHVQPFPGHLWVSGTQLPASLYLGGRWYRVEARTVSATSSLAAHPAVDVGGLRGTHALTGIGAWVDWERYDAYGNVVSAGNLIWRLEPRPDLGGASVASKDHVVSSPSTITGYAIGVRLVPQ